MVAITAAIFALFAEVVTMYIVRRFKRLWKQHHNVYIFHHSIMNFISVSFLIIGMSTGYYRRILEYPPYYHDLLAQVLAELVLSILFIQSCFIIFMTIDWYMFAFYPSKSSKFRKCTATLITLCYLYILIVSLYGFTVMVWNGSPGYLSLYLLIISYLISPVILLIFGTIYLCRRKSSRTNAFVLNMAMLKVFIWIPLLIATYFNLSINASSFVQYVVFTCLVILLLTSVIQLVVSYFCDRNYKAALSRMFDCGKNAEAEDIDNLEQSVEEGAMVYNATNGQVQHQAV